MFLIYKHTNTFSGLSYIGYTKQTMMGRWKNHLSRSKNRNCQNKFDVALREFPENIWNHEVLINNIPTLTSAKANEIEQISMYDSFQKGYNSNPGGGGNPIHNVETRLKISKNHVGMKGKHHSEETKRKLHKIFLNREFSEEWKKKISESLQGHKMSESTKQKCSFTGKKHSKETKKKISESRTGIKRGPYVSKMVKN